MKLLQLKKQLIIRIVIALSISAVIFATYIYLNGKEEDILQHQIAAKKKVSALQDRLQLMKKKEKEITEAITLYQRLNDNVKRGDGLNVETFQKTLEDLRDRYKLTQIIVDFTKPVNLEDIYKTDTTVVVSSTVTLKFSGISDEYLLSFVEALTKELPGYVKIHRLMLSRTSDLTDDLLHKISKGENVDLVSGEMTFMWRDLKDVSKKDSDKEKADKKKEAATKKDPKKKDQSKKGAGKKNDGKGDVIELKIGTKK